MADTHLLVAPPGAGRLDKWLGTVLEVSRSRLSRLIDTGAVLVDGRPVRRSHKLEGGEEVRVEVPPEPVLDLEAEHIDVPTLYLDDDLIVVVKPAGMVVHPAKGHGTGTLVHALLPRVAEAPADGHWDPVRPGIVHRLDKGTSGVMVVARHPTAHAALAEQFAVHSIERRYLALVHGAPNDAAGLVDAPIGRHPRDRVRQAVVEDGRAARTWWSVVARGKGISLLECRLETGRTHQVRVHLQHMGHPVMADPLYAGRLQPPASVRTLVEALDRQLLHARVLAFDHPATGERLRFEAPMPEDMRAVAEAAGLPTGN